MIVETLVCSTLNAAAQRKRLIAPLVPRRPQVGLKIRQVFVLGRSDEGLLQPVAERLDRIGLVRSTFGGKSTTALAIGASMLSVKWFLEVLSNVTDRFPQVFRRDFAESR